MDRRQIFCGLLGLFFVFSIGVARAYNIQDEINAASPGDTINIPDGTYTESVDVPDTLPGLIILGQSRDGTIVTNSFGSGFVIAADNVTIKNLTVKGYTTGRGIDFLSFGTITSGLIDNVIADGNGDGISLDGITASDFKIQNSKIINNNYSPSGIYINDSSNIQITNNEITGNSNGVDLAGATSGITLSGNTFGSNSLYDIFNNTSNNQTATGNDWGTLDGNTINTRIYDKLDDNTLGLVVFDNTNPSVNAGTDKIKKSSFTQDATASDTYGIKSFLWSGSIEVTFSNPAIEDPIVSASTDGTYTLTLKVTDTSGNTNSDTFQLTWDTVAPTSISKTTFGTGWYTSNQTSTFTYTDSGSASCVINAEGTSQTCSITPNICDTAGNCNTTQVTSNAIKLDKTKPTSSVTSPTYDNSGTISVTLSSSDNLSGVVSTSLWYRKNSGVWTNYGSSFNFDPLDIDATYEFYSIATDDAGNIELAPISADSTTIFDHTNPSGTWTSPVVNWTISGTETLQADATDNLSGISSVKFQYKQNNGVDTFHDIATDNVSPFSTDWNTVGLSLDGYSGRIIITDKAGNSFTADRNFYVAAVITSFTHFTVDTNRIQVDWTTDRPTDGHVVYDTHSRSSVDEYAFSTSTEHLAPDYGTSHSIVIGGLADNTSYYFRAVSAGTPVVVSEQGGNKTFTVAGDGGGNESNGAVASISTIFTPPFSSPTTLFTTQFIPVEEILGEATQSAEIFPTPIPEMTGTKIETQNEWPWWSIITLTSVFGLGIWWWIIRRK
ncbi:MAG: right-handed parallel beta-helix repeat-containing protein [Patescibacteria group bacterium]